MSTAHRHNSPKAPNTRPDCHPDVMEWITDRLESAGIRQVGPPGEPRVRPWATVIRIPTDHGDVWFKVASQATAHEIAIYPLLAHYSASLVLQPIAVDAGRSWILLPDGGNALRDVAKGDDLVDHWIGIVAGYAQLQRSLMNKPARLLDLGVPDMRPEVMLHRFDEGLEVAHRIIEQHGTTEDRETLRNIEAARSRYSEWCDELVGSPVSASLDHSDLHGGNVLMRNGSPRLYDWGDSVVAAPFSSLLVLLRSLQDSLDCSPDDPRLLRVRDAYLGVFSDIDSHDRLVHTMEISCRVSKVIRALTWARVLSLDPDANPDWATYPFIWMSSVLEPHYLD